MEARALACIYYQGSASGTGFLGSRGSSLGNLGRGSEPGLIIKTRTEIGTQIQNLRDSPSGPGLQFKKIRDPRLTPGLEQISGTGILYWSKIFTKIFRAEPGFNESGTRSRRLKIFWDTFLVPCRAQFISDN